MNIQILIVKMLLIIFLLTNCSFLANKDYNSNNIIDEFDLNLNEFKRNYKGMTREQIIYIFGNPIISDSFSDSYHYIFYKRSEKNICKKITLNIFFKKNKVFSFNLK